MYVIGIFNFFIDTASYKELHNSHSYQIQKATRRQHHLATVPCIFCRHRRNLRQILHILSSHSSLHRIGAYRGRGIHYFVKILPHPVIFHNSNGQEEWLFHKKISHQTNSCAIKLRKLNALLAAHLNEKACATVRRCEFDDDCSNWFNAPKGKVQIELCLLWMNVNEIISSCS